jgi:hypothetical protein
MNRQQRRAVQARSKKIPLNPIVAFHEAGHAVGRYITAADMGLSVDDAIAFIDVAPGTSLGSSLDKTALLSQSQSRQYFPGSVATSGRSNSKTLFALLRLLRPKGRTSQSG